MGEVTTRRPTAILDPVVWAIAGVVFGTKDVAGLSVIDARGASGGNDDIKRPIADAMGTIVAGGDHFAGLVLSAIRRVIVVNNTVPHVRPRLAAYFTSLRGEERRNPTLLALRLLWVAKYLSLRGSKRIETLDERGVKDECYQTQRWFLGHLPDSEHWFRYLEDAKARGAFDFV